MARPPVKFFQVGSFAAGNRLLDEEARSVQADRERSSRRSGPAAENMLRDFGAVATGPV